MNHREQFELRAETSVALKPTRPLTWLESFRLQSEIGEAIARVEMIDICLQDAEEAADSDRTTGIRLCVEELKILRAEIEEIHAIVTGQRDPRKHAAENSEAAQ